MLSRTTQNILVPTFVVSGFLLAIGLGGAWYVHQANRTISDSLDERLAAAQAAQRLVLAIRELRLGLIRFTSTNDIIYLNDAQLSLGVIENQFTPDGAAAWDDVVNELLHGGFQQQFRELIAEPTGASRQASELITLINDNYLPSAERLLEARQHLASETSQQNQAVADRIGLGLLLLGVCGAVAGLLTGFGVARSVHRSLVEIIVPVHDMAGRLNEVVGPIQVASDAELSQLDESLRMLADKTADAVRQLQESQQQSLRHEQLAAVGQLAAGLAHELRNPLMSVKLIVQTAEERGGLKTRDLEVIEEEISRLEKLLQSFLDFARPPQPDKGRVDVGQLLKATLDVVRPRADGQDVKIHLLASPACVEADASQMRQVFLNLLLNALDALPDGGNIWLTVRNVASASRQVPFRDSTHKSGGATHGNGQSTVDSHVVVAVADDGSGLSPDVADRVFEPFVSTKGTGVGLGLSICRQIVESHKGSITARNRPEGGAEFAIHFPSCSASDELVASL